MKTPYRFFLYLISLIFIVSACSKSNQATPELVYLVDDFIGSWTVYETTDQQSFNRWPYSKDTFESKTVRINQVAFGIVQDLRKPAPEWVGAGRSFSNYDTIYVYSADSTRKLFNDGILLRGTYSAKKDTMNLSFYAAGPNLSSPYGTNGSVFIISQLWIRKK
jgi:hypothetical protein